MGCGAAPRNDSWMEIDPSHDRFRTFLSWSEDLCSAKRVLKARVNCYARGCKWIAKRFYSNDYHTGITAEPEFTWSSQCSQLRPNILSRHDLDNRASETSKRSLGAE